MMNLKNSFKDGLVQRVFDFDLPGYDTGFGLPRHTPFMKSSSMFPMAGTSYLDWVMDNGKHYPELTWQEYMWTGMDDGVTWGDNYNWLKNLSIPTSYPNSKEHLAQQMLLYRKAGLTLLEKLKEKGKVKDKFLFSLSEVYTAFMIPNAIKDEFKDSPVFKDIFIQ